MKSANHLRGVIDEALPLLQALTEAESQHRPSPGKWSPREVIGHLIDSASNNHQRFIRAQFTDDLVCPGYDQNAWVVVQQYQGVSWSELVALWYGFNRHLAHVMAATPEAVLQQPRSRHNLDQIAWQTVPVEETTTLAYFMEDYVGHLEHHLRQILGPSWAASPMP